MINLHERMLPTSAGIVPATSWSPVGRRIQLSHRGRQIVIIIIIIIITIIIIIIITRSGSRWHAIANPHASGRNCPCTTQHSFKQPGKILLVCYSTHHSLQFDMPHDHVVRNLIFDTAPPPSPTPKGVPGVTK